jgi:hypothetical protein
MCKKTWWLLNSGIFALNNAIKKYINESIWSHKKRNSTETQYNVLEILYAHLTNSPSFVFRFSSNKIKIINNFNFVIFIKAYVLEDSNLICIYYNHSNKYHYSIILYYTNKY